MLALDSLSVNKIPSRYTNRINLETGYSHDGPLQCNLLYSGALPAPLKINMASPTTA